MYILYWRSKKVDYNSIHVIISLSNRKRPVLENFLFFKSNHCLLSFSFVKFVYTEMAPQVRH